MGTRYRGGGKWVGNAEVGLDWTINIQKDRQFCAWLIFQIQGICRM
jgi:hypothetical protein